MPRKTEKLTIRIDPVGNKALQQTSEHDTEALTTFRTRRVYVTATSTLTGLSTLASNAMDRIPVKEAALYSPVCVGGV